MKWIYILILLVIAASALGCVDKKQAETPTPAQTQVSPGEAAVTPAATSSVESQTSSSSEDLFGTESNLSAIDTTFDDMNMQISLLDSI